MKSERLPRKTPEACLSRGCHSTSGAANVWMDQPDPEGFQALTHPKKQGELENLGPRAWENPAASSWKPHSYDTQVVRAFSASTSFVTCRPTSYTNLPIAAGLGTNYLPSSEPALSV